jgi:hypothetical protein
MMMGCGESVRVAGANFSSSFLMGCHRDGHESYVCRCLLEKVLDRWTEEEFMDLYNNTGYPQESVEMRKECENELGESN